MGLEIRPVEPRDVDEIVAMVHELAAFEKAPDDCHLTADQLRTALFGTEPFRDAPALFGHVALLDGAYVGTALWFLSFSTWTGVHGVYLEDLFVRPTARGTGAGKALVATLAAICVDRGYERLEWAVLDWNPALGFYKALGAQIKHDWLPHRLAGDPLRSLASTVLPPQSSAPQLSAPQSSAPQSSAPQSSAHDLPRQSPAGCASDRSSADDAPGRS